MRRPSVGWALLVGLLLGVHVNYAGCAALGAAAPVQAADHDHSHGAEVAAAAASASPDSELDAHAHRAAHDGAAHQDVAAAPSAEPHSTSEAAVAGTDAAHAHEDETAVSAEATAHDDHAHDEGGAHDDHANDEGGAHDDGHSHGVGILDFAAVAAELGSVDAARAEVCSQAALEDYDLGLHIGAIFILLGVSAAGALLPVALHISSKSSRVLACIKMGTFFGFGTILSTAFIHMLLPAAQNLSSPCLPASWNEAYEAWAYLFVVISITLMQLVDYLIEGAYQRYLERRGGQPHVEACHEQAHDHDKHTHHAAVVGAIVSLHGSHSPERERDHDSHASQASGPPEDVEAAHGDDGELAEDGGACAVHGEGCTTLIKHRHDPSQIVGIYLMETGIIFHSVLIGITLGVTGGSAFGTLLVALSFHQFFEGFAIGSAVVDSGMTALRSLVMGLAYSVTTPIGIAIGIGMRESFNENSTTTLLVEGIFDSISCGILIYVVLVELINPLMTQSAWLRSRRWWVQVLAFAAFWSGAGLMALIGMWV